MMTDSGIYEYSTPTSQYLPVGSSSYRSNVSTSIIDDPTRLYDTGDYIDSVTTPIRSPYTYREISDTDQTPIQNIDDSLSRSTYRYITEIAPGEPINRHQQQRTVRRQLINSVAQDYEDLANYRSGIDTQGKVPIATQSRSRKPLVVDQVETIETETHVKCEVQRTNETKESTRSERIISPTSSPKKITTTISHSAYSPLNESMSSKRVLSNEQPQYYLSTTTVGMIFFLLEPKN